MKILHIHPTMRSGGIEAIICSLVNEMSINNDVTLCTIFKPEDSDVFYNKLGDTVQRISLEKEKRGFSLKEIFKIYKLIKRSDYDIVHIHGCFYYYLVSILLLHNKVNFFYTVHSNAYMENVSWDKYLVGIKRLFFKKKYMIPITISPVSQKSFYELYQCDSHMIYNGIKLPEIKSDSFISKIKVSETTKVFIHPARITEAKNQITLCRVFKRLIEEGYDIMLLIYGTTEDLNIYNKISPYFSSRIRYMGEADDIPTLMSQSDAFVLPSLWEGLPVTLLEALSVGCIPICSSVGGIINVIQDGQNGILSPTPDECDYYEALHIYLNMPVTEIIKMKKKAQDSFSEFDIKTTSQKYLSTYICP